MGIELELMVLLALSIFSQTFGRFEMETPAWRRILKWFLLSGVTLVIYRLAGHWALVFPFAIAAAGTTVHFVWCHRHGIDPIHATPARRYYKLRGWRWPHENG